MLFLHSLFFGMSFLPTFYFHRGAYGGRREASLLSILLMLFKSNLAVSCWSHYHQNTQAMGLFILQNNFAVPNVLAQQMNEENVNYIFVG